jgi:hypothetical protein
MKHATFQRPASMKRNPCIQRPISRETVMNKNHPEEMRTWATTVAGWSSRFGVSLIFGAWRLVLRPAPVLACALLLLVNRHASAQAYSIDWYTIAGGGGASTGSVYSVSGTIGQPDLGGPLTNGQYSVTAGFWALPTAIQVVGAPTLRIVRASPGQVTISWSPNTAGYVLQETAVISPANWINSPSGATNPVTIPTTQPAKFYRLFKP